MDSTLEIAIRSQLRAPNKRDEKEALFTEKGILKNFSEKIWAAFFLKIIGKETKHDMDIIRSIRNEMAHNMNPVTFETPIISSRIQALKFPKNPAVSISVELRMMFKFTIQIFTVTLMLKSEAQRQELAHLKLSEFDLVKYLDS